MEDKIFKGLLNGLQFVHSVEKQNQVPAVRYHLPEVNVRAVREAMRMSQLDFAELIGIRVKTLQLLEKGRRRPSTAIVLLCRLISADPKYVHDILLSPVSAKVDGELISKPMDVQLKQLETPLDLSDSPPDASRS